MLQPNFKSGWIFRGAVFTGLAALFGMAGIPAAMGAVGEPDIPPLTAQVRAELIDALDAAFRKTYVYEDCGLRFPPAPSVA